MTVHHSTPPGNGGSQPIAVRYSSANPCPVCNTGSKGCSATADGLHLCRGEPAHGWREVSKEPDAAGFRHFRRADEPRPTPPPRAKFTPMRDWPTEAKRLAKSLSTTAGDWIHARLGLPAGALDCLPLVGVSGFVSGRFITSWPEVDAGDVVIGLTERTPGDTKDTKKMLKGGHRGLTLPTGWRERPGPVFVVEGPTDAAALTAAGLSAVGRPSKDGGGKLLAELFAGWPPDREIVIVGENDPPAADGSLPGREAAVRLATGLARTLSRRVLVALPPAGVKDVREWLTSADRGDSTWPDRGAELAAALLAGAVAVDSSKLDTPSGRAKFAVGQRVSPADRENVGTVTEVLAGGCYVVHFVGENGEADVTFREADLRPYPPPADGGNPAGGAVVVPPYRPFPVDALPPAVREFVASVAASVGCDPCFVALPALALVGAAVGGALVARPKRGWNEVPTLWAVVVGDSGTAKSPAADPVTAIAHAIEDALEEEFERAAAEYADALAEYRERMTEKSSERPEKPVPPVREYFTADDVTIERFIENLRTSPRGILLVQDELANWFGSFARYKAKGGGSDAAKWLGMFDGRPVGYQRKTATPGVPRDVRVKRAVASVSGGIQPGILAEALSDPAYLNSGLAARLVFAMPPKLCVRWTDAEPDTDADARFREVVLALRRLPFDPKASAPAVLLDAAARAMFARFHDDMAAVAEGHDGGGMAAAVPKLVRIGLRLAMIHHCTTEADAGRNPGRSSITEASMTAGIGLARWFEVEAERVYAMLSEKPEDRAARMLAEWVGRKGGRVRPRDLQRSNKVKYPTADAAEAALQALVLAGVGQWEDLPPPKGGGWSGRVFVLHPPSDARHSPTLDPDDVPPPDPAPSDTRPRGADEDVEISARPGRVSASVGCRTEGDGVAGEQSDAHPAGERVSDAPPVWDDSDCFHELLTRAGWKWADVLRWLKASPTSGFFEVLPADRQRAADHLARLATERQFGGRG